MCSPKTPDAPAPLAAAPKLPTELDKGTTKKKKKDPYVQTSSRGIYQSVGKDNLGQ